MDRYEIWLKLGSPGEVYSCWSNERWREYFVTVNKRKPINDLEERGFRFEHQEDFTRWVSGLQKGRRGKQVVG